MEALFALPINELLFQAATVHRAHFDPSEVQVSQLCSIKTGGCPEDCNYCSQSSKFDTPVKATKLMEVEKVLADARKAKEAGASRFCMGAAWRNPKERDMPAVTEMIREVKAMGLETCATLGMLTPSQAAALKEAGLDVTEVSSVTGFPEIMDGRVKTLHPKIHGGILQVRTNTQHNFQATEHSIPPIDIVIVNLYPFAATIDKGADFATSIENIDIGGPAMIRAAAKNHESVTVIVDVADYAVVQQSMREHANVVPLAARRRFAAKAFARCASYDTLISSWLSIAASSPHRGEDGRGAELAPSAQIMPPPQPSPYGGGSSSEDAS